VKLSEVCGTGLWQHCHCLLHINRLNEGHVKINELTHVSTDKDQKSWHQRRLLGHFWGLDVLEQHQTPWPQRLSQYQLLEVLSWRQKPFYELVVSDQISHLLAECWFDSSLHTGCKWRSVRNPHCHVCNHHKQHENWSHTEHLWAPDDSFSQIIQ
jgi:hypothetical protein